MASRLINIPKHKAICRYMTMHNTSLVKSMNKSAQGCNAKIQLRSRILPSLIDAKIGRIRSIHKPDTNSKIDLPRASDFTLE